jgi:rare lipoprotein A
MHGLTAAHRLLPFGTRLLVENRRTGEAIEVRVNDRGPFVGGRILDLSYGAARALGAVGPGVIPVRLRVVALPGSHGPGRQASGNGFTVQVGAFTSRSRAETLRDTVARGGEEATVGEIVLAGETYYRVRVGTYPDRGPAQAAARRLAEQGYPAVVVER